MTEQQGDDQSEKDHSYDADAPMTAQLTSSIPGLQLY